MDDLRAEATELERRLSGLHKLIEGYSEVYPDLMPTLSAEANKPYTDEPGEKVPKGQEAVKEVLYSSEGEWFTVTRMVHELQRRGWLGDAPEVGGAVRAALRRAQEADPRIFKDHGAKTGALTYSFRPFKEIAPRSTNEPDSDEHGQGAAADFYLSGSDPEVATG